MKVKVTFLTTQDADKNPQIGDCIVITFDERFTDGNRKACVVIDGGYSSSKVLLKDFLESEGIEIIDLVIATHIDNDHISGLRAFLQSYVQEKNGRKNKFELRNYWGPAPKTFEPVSITEFMSFFEDIDDLGIEELSFISQSVNENEDLYDTVKSILPEDRIFHPSVLIRDYIPKIFNSVSIDIMAPDRQIADTEIKGLRLEEDFLGDELYSGFEIDLATMAAKNKINAASLENNRTANNQSLVIKLTPLDDRGRMIKNCALLFTGDAEEESWEYMTSRWGRDLESSVLKVSHHGSRTGTNESVLSSVKPKYCVICAGKNTHGLPDEDILKMINKKEMKIFCTGRNTKAGESPCVETTVLNKCPRWDGTAGKHIKDHIILEVDTQSKAVTYTENPCGYNWKSLG